MKRCLYLPLLLLGFILPACTKTTNEVVIPNQTILIEVNPGDWKFDAGTYYYVFDIPELTNSANQLNGVIVSMARYIVGQSGEPQSYELLPQVFQDQSYNVLHNAGAVSVEIKGLNGAPSQVPSTKVRFKIVLIPSKQ